MILSRFFLLTFLALRFNTRMIDQQSMSIQRFHSPRRGILLPCVSRHMLDALIERLSAYLKQWPLLKPRQTSIIRAGGNNSNVGTTLLSSRTCSTIIDFRNVPTLEFRRDVVGETSHRPPPVYLT